MFQVLIRTQTAVIALEAESYQSATEIVETLWLIMNGAISISISPLPSFPQSWLAPNPLEPTDPTADL